MHLGEMTWPEIERAMQETRTIIVPIGATEEHGPHLPVFTDTLQAEEVARRAGEEAGVFVAPALPYGVCRSTSGFPGTITLTPHGLRAIINDILQALGEKGFEQVILYTGHAGSSHVAALKEACSPHLSKLKLAIVSDYELVADSEVIEAEMDGHAGEIETSRIMHLRPELVKDGAEANTPELPPHILLEDPREYMGNGVIGDPTRATPEKGEALLELAVRGLVDVVHELESLPSE